MCTSWGDPHVVPFQGSTFHPQFPGSFTLFQHDDVRIQTVQAMVSGRPVAVNTEVIVVKNNVEVYRHDRAGVQTATAAVSQASGSHWSSRNAPYRGFSDMVTFTDPSVEAILHVRHTARYLDVGVEFTGNVSEVTGLCDGSLPLCAANCTAHQPGVCHCSSPAPSEDDFCTNVASCCANLKRGSDPFLNADYRACMEDGVVEYNCCGAGASRTCCAPLLPPGVGPHKGLYCFLFHICIKYV